MRKIGFYVFLVLFAGTLAADTFLYSKVRERNRFLDSLIYTAVKQKGLTGNEEIAISLSREIYRRTNRGVYGNELDWFSRFVSTSFFNMGAGTSLQYGAFGVKGHPAYGQCGTMSRTLLNALWRLRIPARKLQLMNNAQGKGGGHTMIEFYDKGSWRVLSPADSSFVWRNAAGEIATAREIHGDRGIFSQIYSAHPRFHYLFDNYRNIRWEKLPPSVLKVIRFAIGEKKYRTAETPRLYDQPRALFLAMSGCLSIFFGIWALILRPGARSKTSGTAAGSHPEATKKKRGGLFQTWIFITAREMFNSEKSSFREMKH